MPPSWNAVLQGVPLHAPEPSLFFFMDASLTGWGVSWQDHQLSRQWCPQEQLQHINWLELKAANIRKQGGTHSISIFHKTLEIFHLLDQFVIILIRTYLPGARNVTADALSRLNSPSPTEWRLPVATLRNLFCIFGTPLMDMFATVENKVTPIYILPYPDDRVWAVDALSISWDDLGLIYAFPPAPIVPKTLEKIRYSHGATIILVASQHPSRPWHPLLLQLSLRPRLRYLK